MSLRQRGGHEQVQQSSALSPASQLVVNRLDTALPISTKSRKAFRHTAEHCCSVGPGRTRGSNPELSSVTTAVRCSERQRVQPACVSALLN